MKKCRQPVPLIHCKVAALLQVSHKCDHRVRVVNFEFSDSQESNPERNLNKNWGIDNGSYHLTIEFIICTIRMNFLSSSFYNP